MDICFCSEAEKSRISLIYSMIKTVKNLTKHFVNKSFEKDRKSTDQTIGHRPWEVVIKSSICSLL